MAHEIIIQSRCKYSVCWSDGKKKRMWYCRPPYHFGRVNRQRSNGNPQRRTKQHGETKCILRAIQLFFGFCHCHCNVDRYSMCGYFENGRYDNFPFAYGINELLAWQPPEFPLLQTNSLPLSLSLFRNNSFFVLDLIRFHEFTVYFIRGDDSSEMLPITQKLHSHYPSRKCNNRYQTELRLAHTISQVENRIFTFQVICGRAFCATVLSSKC